MQINPAFRFRPRLQKLDQFQNILRGRAAVIHEKIAVFLRNPRTADFCALQSEFVNQPTRRNRRRILEQAAGAWRGRLRLPALPAEFVHALPDLRRPARPAPQRAFYLSVSLNDTVT